MKLILVPALALICAGQALAAPVTYNVEPNHTYPRFSYNHLGFSTQISRFDKTTGTVTLDAEARTGAVDVTIDMKSVNTGSAAFNEHIQKPGLFDTANYPFATFKSTAVKFDGDKPVSVAGILTINGIGKPVTLTVTAFQHRIHPMARKDAIGADATAVIKRSDFNAGMHTPYVGDEVTLSIAVEAIEQ
ncbi:MAG: YceI family protein [Thiobacillus sp.]|nr:YceI family protein [Thiobacillus sp.]